MAETYTIDAQARTITGKKVSQLRTQGLVPAIIYGTKIEPISVQIPYRALELTLLKAGGTHLIDVNVDGTPQTVLARSVQRDVIKGTILHVDFLAIDKTVKIITQIPVHFVGESPVVTSRIGVIQHDLNTLHIEALPGDLIDHVDVDISGLASIGDTVHVKDLTLPSGVTVQEDAEMVVVRVAAPRVVVEEEPTDTEAAASEPEVISKGKADEEEEG